MPKSVAAQQYAYILRLLEEDLGLRYPPVTPRPHCHCPNCGRIVVPDEEGEDEDNDAQVQKSDDQAEEADDDDDEVYNDAHYLDILTSIRMLVKDPSERPHSRPYEIFDPDLIERHSTFGGGRRKAHGRSRSLAAQQIAINKTNRAAKRDNHYAEQDTTPPVRDEDPATSPSSPLTSPPESDETGAEALDSFDNPGAETSHTPQQNLTDGPEPRSEQNRSLKDRKNSTATDSEIAFPTARREIASTSICRRILVPVEHPHLELFLRMFGDPAITATSRTRTTFNDIVGTMSNAGFTVEQSGRCAGSAVAFKDGSHLYNGRTITFHRPHPEPRVPHHMLRKWGKRLSDTFGWTLNSFVEKL